MSNNYRNNVAMLPRYKGFQSRKINLWRSLMVNSQKSKPTNSSIYECLECVDDDSEYYSTTFTPRQKAT